MSDPFDGRLYLAHLRRRWRLPAAMLAIALTTSLVFSLLQTRRYTARVSLVIEPPASSDSRAAMAVSPIYLELLRTYEHFASSDHLFAQAARKFGLRSAGSGPLESLKRSVLRVAIPRNTKILEIAVTLPDAAKAHALALYTAEQTIELNHKTNLAADGELTAAAKLEVESSVARFRVAEAALDEARKRSPTEEILRAELDRLGERRTEIERLALSAALSVADQENRENALAAGGPTRSEELALLRARLSSSRSHSLRLQQEAKAIASEVAMKQKLHAERNAAVELLEAEYKTALEARGQAEKRLRDVQGMRGYRSERISLLDPGFVPERPSSPNVPLNVIVAAALAAMVSLIYLTVEFSLQAQKPETSPRLQRVVGKP